MAQQQKSPINYGSTSNHGNSAVSLALPPSPKIPTHMTTYTAGEDAGRLASMAKEFGLAKRREPREGVRERVVEELGELNLHRLKLWYDHMSSLDDEYLDEIKFSVFSAHQSGEDLSESEWGDDEAEEETDQLSALPLNKQAALQVEDGALDSHAVHLGGTLASATLGIIKGMIGPAILYLPHAFAAAGYAVAIPLLVLSTTMFLWSSHCLLESWRIENEKLSRRSFSRRHKKVHLSYPELAYRSFGSRGERLVQIGISMMQSGVCITYLIFVPQNLHTSARLLFGWDVSTNWCLLFMMAVQIPLSWIRDIRKFKTTNLLGNLLIFYGWIACLGKLATTVQLAYSFAVVFTFPLQNFPSLEIVHRFTEKVLVNRTTSSYSKEPDRTHHVMNIVSAMVVVLLSVIAVTTMDVLDKVVGIMGSLLGIPIAFMMPPLIHNKLGGDSVGKFRKMGNHVCVGLGFVAVAISTIATIMQWS
eukprot:CCRYP_013572-RD/>CCRYP_013572-RD protein AED:0.22 eAED:0.22 QI:103/0.75/0.6/1/0.25/0.2/5/2554/474